MHCDFPTISETVCTEKGLFIVQVSTVQSSGVFLFQSASIVIVATNPIHNMLNFLK